MSKPTQSIRESFVCAKCRGRQADVREVMLIKTGLREFLFPRNNRYIEVTCMLCGYTELYNRAIYAASLCHEKEKERSKMPLPAEDR